MNTLVAMSLFSLSMSISPGPVNLIILSTGVNHGFRKALAFVSGATLGFTVLLLMVGVGLDRVLFQLPALADALSVAGSLFIVYMGYKIARARPGVRSSGQRSCPSFSQGVILQWLNPKAWVACVSGVSAFGVAGSYPLLGLFAGVYFLICYLSLLSWAVIGDKMAPVVKDSNHLRSLNVVMGLCLIAVAVHLLFQGL